MEKREFLEKGRPQSQEAPGLATPILITDPDDPRLEPYRAIRERDLAGRQGRFIVEGEVVLRLMLARSCFGLDSVLMSERRIMGSPDLVEAVPTRVPLYAATDPVIEAIAGFAVHRGILAVGLRGENSEPERLLANMPHRALVVVGISLANHDNMGGLFRNAAAFGANAVLLDASCCDPLYRKAIRVSVGAALVVPFARKGTAEEILALLEKAGFSTFALSPSGSRVLGEIMPPARAAVVLGAEGPGLPRELLVRMTTLRIPMAPDFDSLNVATSSGIALQHFFGRESESF
jgi:tRNA G18 (ribose-2'-O)-methylase SpoU